MISICGFPVPEGTDMANGARQIELIARAAEARLVAANAAWDSALSPPAVLVRAGATQGIVYALPTMFCEFGAGVEFDNAGLFQPPPGFGTCQPFPIRIPRELAGTWMIGAYVRLAASGTVTDGSDRYLNIVIQDASPAPGAPQDPNRGVVDTTQEAGLSHQRLNASRVVLLPDTGLDIQVGIEITQLDPTATVTAQADAQVWAYRLAPLA